MSINTHCKPRPSVRSAYRRATVLNLDTFRKGEAKGAESSAFLLSQPMGGGKTYSPIALALLARDPALRSPFDAKYCKVDDAD